MSQDCYMQDFKTSRTSKQSFDQKTYEAEVASPNNQGEQEASNADFSMTAASSDHEESDEFDRRLIDPMKIIISVLKFMQALCEKHNSKLQVDWTQSRVSFRRNLFIHWHFFTTLIVMLLNFYYFRILMQFLAGLGNCNIAFNASNKNNHLTRSYIVS